MVKLHFRPLISRRAAGACNTMKTLQEIAVMTILKFGIPYRKTLPPILQNEIDTLEHTICRTCTGSDYYEAYRVHNCLNFDISWSYGTWTFVQRGLFEGNDYDQRTVCIRAGKETFMSWVWGNVFGLQFGTQDAGTCFMVTDFKWSRPRVDSSSRDSTTVRTQENGGLSNQPSSSRPPNSMLELRRKKSGFPKTERKKISGSHASKSPTPTACSRVGTTSSMTPPSSNPHRISWRKKFGVELSVGRSKCSVTCYDI